jgi:hypothetical protein
MPPGLSFFQIKKISSCHVKTESQNSFDILIKCIDILLNIFIIIFEEYKRVYHLRREKHHDRDE